MSRTREAGLVLALSVVMAIAFTWPQAARLGSTGRIDSGDGRHGVWNVAWVAHALTTNPARLYDANIFYPHTNTLAFSEANLVAGVLAVPVWLLTGGQALATFNVIVLLAFILASACAYALARTLGASPSGAALAALIYAFCPYALSHLPHIQLLMTFGPALSLLAMHRFVHTPTTGRSVALGASLGVTGLACSYYGVFAGLAVSLGLLWFAVADGRWRDVGFWARGALAAAVTMVIILPFFLPYFDVRDAGFVRTLDETRLHAADLRAYLASPMLAHRWMLPLLGSWREVLFPGFVTLALAPLGVWASRRAGGAQWRLAGFYVVLGVLAFWVSLGPDAGLYAWLYEALPVFSFLRAPGRIGVLVMISLAILSAMAMTWLAARQTWPRAASALVLVVAAAESWAGPLQLAAAPPVDPVYRRLAMLPPRFPVVEIPFYQGAVERHRQTEYMLMSTVHWQPLLNGYSDHFPPDWAQTNAALVDFPSPAALDLLRNRGVRFVVLHRHRLPARSRDATREAVRAQPDRLRPVIEGGDTELYELRR